VRISSEPLLVAPRARGAAEHALRPRAVATAAGGHETQHAARALMGLLASGGSRRGDSNPGPPPYHAEHGTWTCGTPTPLPKRVDPHQRLPRQTCRCGSIRADPDGFGPKSRSWGQDRTGRGSLASRSRRLPGPRGLRRGSRPAQGATPALLGEHGERPPVALDDLGTRRRVSLRGLASLRFPSRSHRLTCGLRRRLQRGTTRKRKRRRTIAHRRARHTSWTSVLPRRPVPSPANVGMLATARQTKTCMMNT
jgi:hypothetical protein